MPGKNVLTPVLERILNRASEVDMSDPGACWDWPGATQHGGYGHVGRGRHSEGNVRVSVVMLEQRLGRPLRPGMIACHTCDRPPCFNPAHLYEGTKKSNQQDALARGRRTVGENDKQAKLTHQDVVAIRGDSRKVTEIAHDFGVSSSLVSMIRAGKRRLHD